MYVIGEKILNFDCLSFLFTHNFLRTFFSSNLLIHNFFFYNLDFEENNF